MRILTDPKLFNYLCIGLYMLSASRWAWEGKWWDVLYWAGAAIITTAVTFNK